MNHSFSSYTNNNKWTTYCHTGTTQSASNEHDESEVEIMEMMMKWKLLLLCTYLHPPHLQPGEAAVSLQLVEMTGQGQHYARLGHSDLQPLQAEAIKIYLLVILVFQPQQEDLKGVSSKSNGGIKLFQKVLFPKDHRIFEQ